MFPNVRRARQYNFNLIRVCRSQKQIEHLLRVSLPKNAGIVRYHVAGDFFKLSYLRAAISIAESYPHILFYSYTKSLPFLSKVDMVDPENGVIRHNFLITASWGGKYDYMIEPLRLRWANVVFDPTETTLPIDHDDSHAAIPGPSFSLLLHGIQPAGSQASLATTHLRNNKYTRKG